MEEQENAWPCFECNQRFTTSIDLQKHLNQHDGEDGNGPKTRTKSRAKAKIAKKGQFTRVRVNVCFCAWIIFLNCGGIFLCCKKNIQYKVGVYNFFQTIAHETVK